jgi:hypothetical protein
MKRLVPIAGLSIVFGLIISWGEGIAPLLNFGSFNMIDIKLVSLLISLMLVLILVVVSDSFVTAFLSAVLYVVSFIGVKLYFRTLIGLRIYTYVGIIFVSALAGSILLFYGKHLLKNIGDKKLSVKKDLAMPVIFFLLSILFAAFIVLSEQKVMYPAILNYFYSYLYFLVAVMLGLSILSFNEVSGFLIGFFSIPIYFLMNRLIMNNFNFTFLIKNEYEFFVVVAFYSILFAFSTALIAHDSKVFLNGVIARNSYRIEMRVSKKGAVQKGDIKKSTEKVEEKPVSSNSDNKIDKQPNSVSQGSVSEKSPDTIAVKEESIENLSANKSKNKN